MIAVSYTHLDVYKRQTLVSTPATSGTTTNRKILINNVLYGTTTFETPSKNFTIGTKANKMIRSFVATCTTVYAGLPSVRVLQTKTMACLLYTSCAKDVECALDVGDSVVWLI